MKQDLKCLKWNDKKESRRFEFGGKGMTSNYERKKINENNKILKQDMSQTADRPGSVFVIHLLMEEKCKMPEKELMHKIMREHFGETDCFCYDGNMAGFAPKKYSVYFEKEKLNVHPQLIIMNCSEIEKPIMDDVAATQLWGCPNGSEILETCKYQVMATDMLAAGLDYKERAEMLVHYVEALVNIYPTCKAVVFETSKKMLTREEILNCNLPEEMRFIHYAVNVRFFNIQGTNDMLIDSLGMSTLFLPDIQYHFHGLNPNDVVNHAYNVLSYIYDNDNPIEDGNTIAGLTDGTMDYDVKWKIQYEDSLIQPIREVIDINMGEYASGNR